MGTNAAGRKILTTFTALALVSGLLPLQAYAVKLGEPSLGAARTEAEIEAEVATMLASNNYVEGEAIVCSLASNPFDIRAFFMQPQPADALLASAEELSTVTVADYVEGTEESIPGVVSTEDAASAPEADEEVAVSLVHRDDMTTEELLRALLADPHVLSAEPNYLMGFADKEDSASFGAGAYSSEGAATQLTLGGSENGAGASTNDATSVDLTNFQWFSTGAASTIPQYTDAANPGIHVPGWNDPSATNADPGCVVAILDSGVDYTHPDLKDVMYRFSNDLQAQLGCGEFGYAPARDDTTDPMDGYGHGTHCAGIVAAQWNGFGVSGVANGAKICAVSISRSVTDQNFSYDGIIKGYDFLIRAAKAGVDIRAVNRSLESDPTNNADQAMMQAAGEAGIVTCIAAGNTSRNLDETYDDIGVAQQNPYVLRVNASNQQDGISTFSCYGANITDVFAPGAGILSTIPTIAQHLWAYYPAADPDPLFLETAFDGALPHVYVETTSQTDEGDSVVSLEELETSLGNIGADGDGRSVHVHTQGAVLAPKCLVVDVPVGDLSDADVQDMSMAVYFGKAEGKDPMLEVQLADGTYTEFGKSDTANRSVSALYGWVFAALHVDDPTTTEKGFMRVTDAEGRTCIRLKALIKPYSQLLEMGDPMDLDLYIDQIAFGRVDNNAVLPYRYMSGTSMATPCVAGCVAVVSSTLQGATPAARAATTVRILKGAVRQAQGYRGFCKQDGQVDLGLVGQTASYAPVLESAQVNDNAITVEGVYFGSAGTVVVDGTAAHVLSWSDTSLTVEWPDGMSAGLLSIEVKTAAATQARAAFALEAPPSTADRTLLYERDLVAPRAGAIDTSTATAPSSIVATEDGILFAVASETDSQQETAMRVLLRSDDQAESWTAIDLPQKLKYVSLAEGDGAVFVLGATPADELAPIEQWHLYRFDIAQGTFTLLGTYDNNDGKTINQVSSLAYVGGRLYIADSVDNENYTQSRMRVRVFDVNYIPGQDFLLTHTYPAGTLAYGLKASVAGSSIYLCGLADPTLQDVDDHSYGLERIDVGADGTLSSTDLSAAFDGLEKGIESKDVCIVADPHGVFLVGRTLDQLLPEGADYTDTYFLREGATTFEPYGHTLSFAPVYAPQGVSMDDQLLVFAKSQYESMPVFGRATQTSLHVWGEASYVWADDNSEVTATHVCTVCGKSESETVKTTSSVTKEPTQEAAGTRTFTATFASSWAQTQTKDAEIPKLDPEPKNSSASEQNSGPSSAKATGTTTVKTGTVQAGQSAPSATAKTGDDPAPYGLVTLAMLALVALGASRRRLAANDEQRKRAGR